MLGHRLAVVDPADGDVTTSGGALELYGGAHYSDLIGRRYANAGRLWKQNSDDVITNQVQTST